MAILLVEQNARAALSIADRAYVLEVRTISLEGSGKELLNNVDLLEARKDLSTIHSNDVEIKAVILGCPHFSFTEFQRLAESFEKSHKKLQPDVRFIVLTNQMTFSLLKRSNIFQTINDFGVEIVLDTCVFHSPIVSAKGQVIMTGSGKCAFYAPGELAVNVVFGNIEECVRSAVEGVLYREVKP